MSVICQTFVQNTWRKDLCSNCFKSKEEHEADGRGGGGVGRRGSYRDDDGGSINSIGLNRGLDSGVGGGSKRYMGVAGSVYQRSYYNRNSWQSMMLDKSDSGLKSPGLIKGMSHLVCQENEKNLKLSDMIDSDDKLRSSRLVQCVKTSQSEAKLLTELLGDGLDEGRLTKEKKKEPDKPFLEDKGDVSSDLGSEASNDISSSSSASSSSYNTCSPANSDTTSVKSDASSEQFEAEKEEFIGRDIGEENNEPLVKDEELAEEAPPVSILKKAGDPKSTRGSINFRSTLEEVIGYGGDVDYSDDEDLLDDDDDDDDYDDFMELTPDERVLRRLTEKNTDFNSDNDNLKKDIEELLPSVKELEEKRKMIIAEIEELERLGRERSKNDSSKQLEEKKEEKPEGKVKLKRSPPLVSIKPLIARNHNEVRVNQVWPMKNGEIVRPVASNELEEIPLKGIKPKYVAREDEMVEKVSCEGEMKTKSGKITSIDDVCNSNATKKEKFTSIDDTCISGTNKKGTATSIDDVFGPVVDDSVKSGEVGLGEASAITRIDNLISQQDKQIGSQEPIPKPVEVKNDHKAKSDIKTLPSISVMPRDYVESNSDKGIKMTEPPQTESFHSVLLKETPTAPEIKPLDNIDAKEIANNAPVSAPRKSLPNSQEEKPNAPNDYKQVKDIPVENLGKTFQQVVKLNETSTKVTETLGTERNENEKQDSRVSSGDINANKMVMRQKLNNPDAPSSTETLMPSKLISSDHEVLEVQTSKNSLRVSCNIPDDKSITGPGEAEAPKTPESLKTPASRQGSTSSLFTTFGTPVIASTSQNSFLHSPSSRSMYDDVNSPSNMYTPASTDFLKEIKSQPEVPTPTAGIQKSALYASTSCLKGLPGAKPVITPKPPILKEKPKVPFKPAVSTSRIYATPSPIATKPASSNLNGAVSTPNLLNNEEKCKTTHVISNSPEPVSDSLYKVPPDQKKPPPTTQAPAIPSVNQKDEVVYDIPVTVASSQPNNSVNPPPASSPRNSKPTDDATIYQEIDDRLKTNRHLEESNDNLLSHTPDSSGSEQNCSLASVTRVESTRCQSRSTFEANRSMLSAALDFGSSPLGSSGSKRLAPQPPAEEETIETEELPAETTPVSLENSEGTENFVINNQQTQDFSVPLDNNDGESYSSFTDDFDDDEEEEEEQAKLALRKAERSSSAVPFYRNSVGAIMTSDPQSSSTADPNGQDSSCSPGIAPGWDYVTPGVGMFNKPLASRSHSVPRATEHMVIIDPSPSATSAFSSKFSFGRSGFFRPSSPPTLKRDSGNNSDRGRDRTKKSSSSRFSLKKLLRLGSKDDEKKNQKEQEKRLLRETKRSKLQIIHPLDYNQNGVEVIARPEKTSPIYDYTGIYGYIPPPRINNSKLEDVYASVSSVSQVPPVQASPALSLSSKRSEISADSASPYSTSSSAELSFSTPAYAISSTLPTVSTKSSYASPISSVPQISSTSCSSSVSNTSSSLTYSGGAYASVPATQPGASTSTLEKRNSFLRKETNLERCESSASHSSSINNLASATHHLGYNSEGRPKPPPPPRKGSLETSQPNEIYSSVADLTAAHLVSDSVPSTDAPSRPQRPPPPTRTPSNAGSKSGPPRPDPPKLGRDSVYANLGDVRAPITPRKPGRSSSIRGDEDREKRRAPQPPSIPHVAQEAAQLATQRTIRHQHQDSTSSSCSSISSTNRASKGPAPPRPQQPQQNYDYDTLEHNSASAANVTQIVVGSTSSTVMSQSRLDEVYQVPQNNSQTIDSASAPSLRQEKMGRLSVRRGSAVTHRSLEDQYGAVISANLEALSNMLDQLSNTCCPPGYEEVGRRVRRWEDIVMDDDIVVGAGHRLFYAGVAYGREITLMLTPETKVDAHHLLTPMPIVTFRDQIPTHLLSHKTIVRGKTSAGTVWVLPSLSLTTLKTLADESSPQLLKAPLDWERHTCLLLLQYVTGLKQLQAQGVEDTSIDLTLVARASEIAGQDPDPRIMLVPPVEAGIPVMSLCECAAAATLMLMGVDTPLERVKDGNFCIPSAVPSQQAFSSLLKLLRQEKAGSLTQVKCVLEVLLFGPDSSGIEGESSEEVEAGLQRWLDLERATVLHSLIRGPLESSILIKYHLLFLVRSNSKILRETIKFCEGKEELNC